MTQKIMNEARPDPVETGAKAREIYLRNLKAKLEPGFNGKYIIIDTDSGDYELGDDVLAISKTLRERRPNSRRHVLRVGYPAAGRLGARPRK